MREWWEGLLSLVFPPGNRCELCGREGAGLQADGGPGAGAWAAKICSRCRQEIEGRRKDYGVCSLCGRFIARGAVLCSVCSAEPPFFSRARAVGPYEGELKRAVRRLKYGGKRRLAGVLGVLLAEVIVAEGFLPGDFLVPVPMFPRRERERGYNQALLLAAELSKLLGIPVGRFLSKVTDTPDQVGLSRDERARNLAGAFRAAGTDGMKGKRLFLIDDVYTTGATAAECARALLGAGAREVLVAVVCTGVDKGGARRDLRKPEAGV